MLYWTVRVLLVLAWLAAARLACTRGGRRGGAWRAGVAATLLFASMRAWPWNYLLLEGARGGLRAAGVYDDRLWAKIVVGALFVAVVASGAATSRWRRLPPAVLVAHLGAALQAALLTIETASLDEALPGVLFQQPWRYGLEGAFAAMTLAGLSRARAGRTEAAR